MTQRELFLKHVGQTSTDPLGFEVSRAEGIYLYDQNGQKHIDLIGGISVCNTGHGHPKIIEAIQNQIGKYMHVMVYGETIQSPQTAYAKALSDALPEKLNSVYFTNSGSEATEGAMKLAKRYTGRSKIFSFKNSYHGSTQGALSVMGSEYWQQAYRPLLPNVHQFIYGDNQILEAIDEETACIIVEPIQSEAGVHEASKQWFEALRSACDQNGTLLIFDEIQTGFGRTGKLFAMERIGVIPDIVLLGKALGGGLPLGAFVSDVEIMNTLAEKPVLGHITTFGGHPVCCAAGLAALQIIQDKFKEDKDFVFKLNEQMHSLLNNKNMKAFKSYGLLAALHFESYEKNKAVIDTCIKNGLFTDWFLFAAHALRIAPPLTISSSEMKKACDILNRSIDEVYN